MIKRISYLLILLLPLVSCIHKESTTQAVKITNDSTNIHSVKKDSIVVPIGQEDQIKESLIIEGSVQKVYDSISVEFNLSELNYEIVYEKEGQLYFYDIKSNNIIIFPDTSHVCHFGFSSDGKTLYYTVLANDSLQLKGSSLDGKKAIISTMRRINIPYHEFRSFVSGEFSTIDVYGDTLSIQYGMNGEFFSFRSQLHIVANADLSYEIKSLSETTDQTRSKNIQQQYDYKFEKMLVIQTNEYKELFLMTDSDTIKMSDAEYLNKEHNLKMSDNPTILEYFDNIIIGNVKFSPDESQIIYSYPISFNDLVHGPMCIVNANGEFHKLLTIGGFDKELPPKWLPNGNNLLFRRAEKEDRYYRNDLYMTINTENDIRKIDEEVGQYLIRINATQQ